LLLVAVLVGCSANGGSVDTASTDAKVSVDATDSTVPDTTEPVDTSASEGDAIFPSEDVSIGDGSDCAGCVDVPVNVQDCGYVTCPTEAPYPVGCSITMGGTDSRGCVVSSVDSPIVRFKVGTACSGTGDGFITGIVRCAPMSGTPLNATNCKVNKLSKTYASTLAGCPG
jgi:hypothetical protein